MSSSNAVPDNIWNTSVGYLVKLRKGIRSSWEDDDGGLWIHHFMILQLIHPVFITHEYTPTFLNNNNAAMIKKMNNAHIHNYMSWFNYRPKYKYIWLGVINDENQDRDADMNGEHDGEHDEEHVD